MEEANHKTNSSKFWKLLRSLCGKKQNSPPNQPINFNDRPFTKHSSIARKFNKQFSSVSTHRQDPNSRRVIRNIHRRHKLDPHFTPFTPNQVVATIRLCRNSTATGPDGITILHLKHLGPSGISFLTEIFNQSISSATIPALWKHAIIIPILKPGKPPDSSRSYRPISILSPVVKILERQILPSLTESLSSNPTQHGFKKQHSTTTALLPLVASIAQGLNQPKPATRTAAIAIDYSKAFDSVHHPTLLNKLCQSTLHPNIIRWLTAYLRGRTCACLYMSSTSKSRIIRTGVPQRAVLSPILFNFFTSDCPRTADINSSYADDVTIAMCHRDQTLDASQLADKLSGAFAPIEDWARQNHLTIAPSKSSVSLFTPWNRQFNAHPKVLCNWARTGPGKTT